MAAITDDVTDILQDRMIRDEYNVWKKNSPFLYDSVISSALVWPSLTCEFLPTLKPLDDDFVEHQLLLGTHTGGGEMNHLMVASVCLCEDGHVLVDEKSYDETKGEVGGHSSGSSGGGPKAPKPGKVDIKVKINHEGEVNRARYMPQNSFVVATKSPSSEVFIFDISKHPSAPKDETSFKPQHRCLGHTKEGYGLAWSPHDKGHLISGSEDGVVCIWDINEQALSVQANGKLKGHSAPIWDVAWHMKESSMIGSVSSDKSVILWDTRKNVAAHTIAAAHEKDINSISFNPINEHLFATGSADNTVGLWDKRNLKTKLHSFTGHKDEVFQVQWAPFNESILASSSSDRRVNVYDLSRIGQEQDPEDAEDGPPELLFIHGGHTGGVNDFCFNANDPWTVASVSDDNLIQVWKMAEDIYADFDDDDEDKVMEKLEDEDLE